MGILKIYSLPDNKIQREEIYKILLKKENNFIFLFEEKYLKTKKI